MGDLIGRQTDVRRFGGAASGKARLIGQPLQYLVGRSYKDDRFNHLVGTSCGHSGAIPSGMCLLTGARFLFETEIRSEECRRGTEWASKVGSREVPAPKKTHKKK